jgi:UDP-N-acetylglucosamine--N-acetylmuramyl-(pentapeptide) pyrophosphoryl-undecaprenol N-acetylglucosamine transferase
MPESQFTAFALAAQITAVLTDGAAALKMSQMATACGKPDATERLVALVEDLAAKE